MKGTQNRHLTRAEIDVLCSVLRAAKRLPILVWPASLPPVYTADERKYRHAKKEVELILNLIDGALRRLAGKVA